MLTRPPLTCHGAVGSVARDGNDTLHIAPRGDNDTLIMAAPANRATVVSFPVSAIQRDIRIKVASSLNEWEDALRLVAENYRARGYEPSAAEELRFTPYHALPDTTLVVAKEKERVIATLSLVPDNTLLGLPLEQLYGPEVAALRAEGRRLVEVTSLADRDLSLREFTPVFTALMRFVAQYICLHRANTLVIVINPRHRLFYQRIMGFRLFGEERAYAAVEQHPAEAFLLDVPQLKQRAPQMFQQLYRDRLPREVLRPWPLSELLVRVLARQSRHISGSIVDDILRHVSQHGSPRRWR